MPNLPLSVRRAIAAACAIVLAYTAWPFWAAWQLRQAVRLRDVAALERTVDWPTLRANIKPHLNDAIASNAAQSGAIAGAIKRTVGGMVAGPAVDWVLTPATLGRLLAGRAFVIREMPSPSAQQAPPADTDDEDADDPLPPRRLRWAFFESLTRFRIEATHPRIAPSRIAAILALEGTACRLVDVQIVTR